MSFIGHAISDFIFGDRSAERAAAAQQNRIRAVPLPPTIVPQAPAGASVVHMPPHHSHIVSAAAHPPVPTNVVCSNAQCRRILTPVDRFCSTCGAPAVVAVLVPAGAGHMHAAAPAAHFQGPQTHCHHHQAHHHGHHHQAPIVCHQYPAASAPVQHHPNAAQHSAALHSSQVHHQHPHPQNQFAPAAASAVPPSFEPGDPAHQRRNQDASAPGQWAEVSKNGK